MNTLVTACVVLLSDGTKVWSVLETLDPCRAHHIALQKIEHEPGITRVSIHEFPAAHVPPILEIVADSPEDDRTVVFVATKPKAGGIWDEKFYHGFNERVLGIQPGSRNAWVL